MDFSFHTGKLFKYSDTFVLNPTAQASLPDDIPDDFQVPRSLFPPFHFDLKPRPENLASRLLLHFQMKTIEREVLNYFIQVFKRKARIQQGTYKHIPANTRETVEVGYFHVTAPCKRQRPQKTLPNRQGILSKHSDFFNKTSF